MEVQGTPIPPPPTRYERMRATDGGEPYDWDLARALKYHGISDPSPTTTVTGNGWTDAGIEPGMIMMVSRGAGQPVERMIVTGLGPRTTVELPDKQ